MKKRLRIAGWIFLLLFLAVLVAAADAALIEPRMLVNQKNSVESRNIEETVKIVFFSDTHFGRIYDPSHVEQLVGKINGNEPDLVIFGGDFFDVYWQDKDMLDLSYLSGELQKLKAKYGKYAVWGNRDRGGGAIRIYEQFMEDSGFTILKNNSVLLKEADIRLTGLDDVLLGAPDYDVAAALDTQDEGYFHIAVIHEPDAAELLDAQSVDLVLSGHTHGGQIRLPVLTKKLLPPEGRKYIKGEYQVGELRLIVSSGVGMTKLPLRFLDPPEIRVVTINPTQ